MSDAELGFLPCVNGPFDKQLFRAGDDVPEGWRVTLTVPFDHPLALLSRRMYGLNPSIPEIWRGVYVRKGDVLVWEEMK